ncbi:MAG: amidohydrolase family protein, partial [Alphaproteobacteria bacterium]
TWRAAAFAFPSSGDGSYIPENESVLAAARSDSRLLPVAVVNPAKQENLDWVLEHISDVRGLMIWPILCDLDLIEISGCETLWKAVEEHDVPVTVHVGVGNEANHLGRCVPGNRYDPEAAVALAASLPAVRFNLSHVLRLSRAALQAVRDLDNVMMDISGLSALGRLYENGCEVFPALDNAFAGCSASDVLGELAEDPDLAGRLMFGSSWPFSLWWGFDPQKELEHLNSVLPKGLLIPIIWQNPCAFYSETPG